MLATNSLHLPGVPFSNIFSFADGTSDNSTTGNVYFFASPLDTSMHDLAVRPHASSCLASRGAVTQSDGLSGALPGERIHYLRFASPRRPPAAAAAYLSHSSQAVRVPGMRLATGGSTL